MTRAMDMSDAGAGSADGGRVSGKVGPHLTLLRRVPWWEWALLTGFSLVLVAVAGPRGIATASCRVDPFPLVFGADTGVSLTVKAGHACTVRARTASAAISHFEIDSQPAHGQIQRRGRTGVVYRPQSRYRGEDSFGFALSGASSGGSGTAIIRVKVTVR